MRIFLSLALLFALLTAIVVFAWIFRQRLYVLFGIKQRPQQQPHRRSDLEAQEFGRGTAIEAGFRSNQPKPNSTPKGGGRQLDRSSSDNAANSRRGGSTYSDGSSASSNSMSAPMIVIADAPDTNRGASLPYDALAAACGEWAESRRIGSGGAATVYRAELPRYGTVAVKRFHPKEGSGREWTRELEALCKCRHPHILEIIGHADEGPENLIVMPLMEGGTLCEAMHNMVWAIRVIDMGQIVRALSFLHGKGILHRDVKSSNILLDKSLRYTRLADFGLAKDQVARAGMKTSHGTTGVVVGSPGYMAPELMMRPATEKTDAYATGVVLLEILTGLPAWDHDENGAVLTDRAVVDGKIKESLIDPAANWPRSEVAACGMQAIALTLFDPSQRKTLAAMEQDPDYVQHLERAGAADLERSASPGSLDS